MDGGGGVLHVAGGLCSHVRLLPGIKRRLSVCRGAQVVEECEGGTITLTAQTVSSTGLIRGIYLGIAGDAHVVQGWMRGLDVRRGWMQTSGNAMRGREDAMQCDAGEQR